MEDYEKSGKIFIAYKGKEYDTEDIAGKLRQVCPAYYTVKSYTRSDYDVVFSKIVRDNYSQDRDPYYNSQTKILTVSGYNQQEIAQALRNYSRYEIEDSDRYHTLINKLYKDYGETVFRKLSDNMDFCSVIWDERVKGFIAGVTDGESQYTSLFYGPTKLNGELMFSNDESILRYFCSEVKKMAPNTYMKNGELFTLDGEKIETKDPLIKKTRENADNLLDGLNALLVSITKEAVRDKIEANLEEYLESDDPKKRLADYIVKELDTATQREVLEIIKKTVRTDLINLYTK